MLFISVCNNILAFSQLIFSMQAHTLYFSINNHLARTIIRKTEAANHILID